jgi:hypothetical protein
MSKRRKKKSPAKAAIEASLEIAREQAQELETSKRTDDNNRPAPTAVIGE